MSKSLGNFITLKDFIAKYHNGELLKFFFLSAHYGHPMDYTEAKIEEARQAMERIRIFMDKAKLAKPNIISSFLKITGPEVALLKHKFMAALNDDFNTPEALACVFELVNLGNKNIAKAGFVFGVKRALDEMLNILGVSLSRVKINTKITQDKIKLMMQNRALAKQAKDYLLADKIRKELEEQDVILEDTKEGTTWRRKL
jgi:cysteinyl-tRNA synthetase